MAIQQNQSTIAQLKALGFSDARVEVPKRLVASVYGPNKTGKTHLALTAPDPIVFFNIDIGTEGVVGKFQDAGKQVLVYDVRVPKKASQDVYASIWNDLKVRVEAAFRLGRGTVVIDTGSEAYELSRLAAFGKLTQILPHNYQIVNTEWREFMRMAYDSSMSAIFIHKVKSKWVDNKRTSEQEISGMGEMPYLVQINISTSREDRAGGSPQFRATIDDCRQNADLCGASLDGPMFDFTALLDLVHDK